MSRIDVIKNDYVTVSVYEDGKHIEIDIADGVKVLRHQTHLKAYVEKLWQSGITKLNADQISLPYLDKSINLKRGDKRLDLVYYKNGRIHECEFKTHRECGLDITYSQVKGQKKYCENFILLVPSEDLIYVQDMINTLRLHGVTVTPYDQ